jgi:predicted nuclease of predicted toxin-antitoxin system
MRFLVDECTGTSVANWLKKENHEVYSVFEQWRGASDESILEKCHLKITYLLPLTKILARWFLEIKKFIVGLF